MKKKYIKPSMKVVKMNVESVILAGSGELNVNPTSTTRQVILMEHQIGNYKLLNQ